MLKVSRVVKSNFNFLWVPLKNGIKSGKHSYGHLAGTIQNMHKIVTNAKFGSLRVGAVLYYLTCHL